MPPSLSRYLARRVRRDDRSVGDVAEACSARLSCEIAGTDPAARPFLVATLWREVGGCMVVWTSTPDAADRFASDCAFYLDDAGSPVRTLAPADAPHAISNPSQRSERLETLAALAANVPGVYSVSHAALRQPLADPQRLRSATLRLRVGDEFGWERLLASLVESGYERVEVVGAVGEFAVRGGLIDVFPATADAPVRLEFDGDALDAARTFALSDQRSTGSVDAVEIVPWTDDPADDDACALDYAPSGAVVVIDDPPAIVATDAALARERDDATVIAADLEPEGGVAVDLQIDRPTPHDVAVDLQIDRPTPHGVAVDLQIDRPTRRAGVTPELDRVDTAALPLDRLVDATRARAVLSLVPAIGETRIARPADVRVAIIGEPPPAYGRSIEQFADDVRARVGAGETVAIVSVAHRRVREVLSEHAVAVAQVPSVDLKTVDLKIDRYIGSAGAGAVYVTEGTIDAGFSLPQHRIMLLGDFELFGHAARRHKLKAIKEGVPVTEADLKVGEYFVHANHGIGQYLGLEHIAIDDIGRDFVQLKYAGEDRLYVPTDQMHLIRKFVATDGTQPRLSKMGGSDWARTRTRVREAVEKIAEGLVKLYAEREVAQGHAFVADTPWQAELEESFPYDETPDQQAAIEAVKDDMERPRPMDRLICGDVGYGKTEVAIRAAFKAIMDRKQVALLAPTTVLAAQHFRSFTQRFSAFPVNIALLSRFRSKEQQRESARGLLDGSVDLAIGTHRLLQTDIGFARLGLVIVDEEQRFGVMHKERLKELRRSVDVLTLSATPIPRTLHMSMLGVRDLSLIRTPPANRMAIKTVVAPSSDALIANALRAELERGGQAYFVHDRIQTIYGVAAAVQKLAPRARIRIGHGQMDERELEAAMVDFVEGRFDVLVSTTIIENGLDIPNVNTIIVNNADRFGLGQLYQLRGRVGRSAHQAFAYFLYQPQRSLSETAEARLEAIREFSHLGSGLQLAMRDLEIRGAGNLLGRQQHGFIATVGFDTYCQILQDAIAQRKGQPQAPAVPPPVLDLRVSAYIPGDFVRGANQKIAYYQRIAAADVLETIDRIADEIRDRFGPLPPPVDALLELARVRIIATRKGVEKLALEQRRLTLDVGDRFSLSEHALDALKSLTRGNFRFTQGAIVAQLPPRSDGGDGRLSTVREIVAAL